MKALVLKEQSFQLEEVENPILQKDQALVKVHFAALNHRDQWIREGQYAKSNCRPFLVLTVVVKLLLFITMKTNTGLEKKSSSILI